MAQTDEAAANWLRGQGSLKARAGAFGLALAYYVLAALCAVALSSVQKSFTGLTLAGLLQSGARSALLGHAVLLAAFALIPTAIMILSTRAPYRHSGWSPVRGLSRFGVGVLIGAGAMAAIAAVLSLTGAARIQFGAGALAGAPALVVIWAFVWIVQSAHEEAFSRGYGLVKITRALGFWPAAVLSSIAFAASHANIAGETPIGLFNAALVGLALAYTLLRTGSLWLALGFHASWNFMQSSVFGLANSGSASQEAVAQSIVTGPLWLTGGSAGPEGGVLATLAALVLFAVARLAPVRR